MARQEQPINIVVDVNYLEHESQPEEQRYVYAYTINIENRGTETLQLISRYWKIVDAHDAVQEVQGLGVLGEQPTLYPGQNYVYTSGVILNTEDGLMEGSYTMHNEQGDTLDVPIPPFALVKRSRLH